MICIDLIVRIGKFKFWQRRNWTKYMLTGAISRITTLQTQGLETLTESEKAKLKIALEQLQSISDYWKNQNDCINYETNKRI